VTPEAQCRRAQALALYRALRATRGAQKPRVEWRCAWTRDRDLGCLLLRVYETPAGALIYSPSRSYTQAVADMIGSSTRVEEWADMLAELPLDRSWAGFVFACGHMVPADVDPQDIVKDLAASAETGRLVRRVLDADRWTVVTQTPSAWRPSTPSDLP
jgi:hypothetical protein